MSNWKYADVWEVVAEDRPEAPAVIHGERHLTWGAFDARADGVATALLDAGLQRQAKVAQYLYNCPEYLESMFAALKVGMAPVNTNYRYTENELVYLWDNADAEAVVFHIDFAPRIEAIRHRLPKVRLWLWVDSEGGRESWPPWATPYEQAAATTPATPHVVGPWGRSGDDLVLIYTGGTTGMPKGVMWRQDDLFALFNRTADVRYPEEGTLADVAARLRAPSKYPSSRLLPGPPLMHGTGLLTAMSSLACGGTIVMTEGHQFSAARLLDTVERHRVTQLVIVGDAFAKPILAELDAHPGRWDLSSLWLVISSGVMWSSEVKAGLLRHLPRLILMDSLGSSEAIGVAQSRSDAKGTAGTAGFVLGPDTRVIDDDGNDIPPGSGRQGLVAIRGRGPIGYYKDPEKSAATFRVIDGQRWAIPGDFATVEAGGVVKLLGRGSVCINTGGEKVFPEEVEEALKTHAQVLDAVVVGVPDQRFGEMVVAVVEPRPGAAPAEEELIAWVKERLAGYKAPRRIIEVATIARAPNGKVDYRRLRDHAVSTLAAAPSSPG